jgi:glycosyltransferase involved in cell wall biosynthesis
MIMWRGGNVMIEPKPTINVLWAVDHLGFNGKIHGAGMFYLNVIPAFDKRRFDITMCVLRKKDHLHTYVEKREIKKIYYLGKGKYDPLTLFELLKVVKKEKIDIMHLHGYGSDNFGRLVKVFVDIPAIVHSHDPFAYYPWFQKLADGMLARLTDASLAVSDSIKHAAALKRSIPLERIEVLPTCAPLECFKPLAPEERDAVRARLGIPHDAKVIGTITRLYEQKGNEYLIRAFPAVLQELPGAVCLIVGDGPLRCALEVLSRTLGVEQNMIFLGHCNNVRDMLGALDVKVFPSLWEGTPLTMLEAMAMGEPIVATSVDGMKEVLKDGETALLVPPRDPRALAEGIIYLLREEPEARRLGLNAQRDSRQYDTSFCVKRLEGLYERLYESRRSRTA